MEINEENVFDAWKKSLRFILDNGVDFIDGDGRTCREILNLVVKINNPEEDYERPIDIMQELDWIYPSKEELEAIIINKEQTTSYEYTYGPRIFNFKNVDQINDFVVPLLKKDKMSRRAIVILYDPSKDSNILSKNIPSLVSIYFKVSNDALNLTSTIRSNDLFIGWPGNIYQIILLQKYVANLLGLRIGTLTTISFSAHIFHEHFDIINEILRK